MCRCPEPSFSDCPRLKMCSYWSGELKCKNSTKRWLQEAARSPEQNFHCTSGRKGPLAFCPLIATVQQRFTFTVLEMSPAFETWVGRTEAYMNGKRGRLESVDGFGLEHHGAVAMLRSGRKNPLLPTPPRRGCSSTAAATALQGAWRQTCVLVHGSPRNVCKYSAGTRLQAG